jgi:hypothetical protein
MLPAIICIMEYTMKKTILLSLTALTSLPAISAYSQDVAAVSNVTSSHEGHNVSAPSGIMGDHLHKKGQYMFSYSFENMNMEGYRNGTNKVSNNDIFMNGYTMAATDMSMQMHMFNGMYGFTDNLTGMLMVPYTIKKMDMVDMMGMESDMESKGLGDIKISAATNVYSNHDMQNHSDFGANISFGLSLPTGSIDEDESHMMSMGMGMPMMMKHNMNYDMQLGSGTVDPTIGATVYNKVGKLNLGLQAMYTPRFGKNDNGYRLGDEAKLSGWAAYGVTDFMNASFRLDGKSWGKVEGQDRNIDTTMMPGGLSSQNGGERIDALVGVEFYKTKTQYGTHKLGLEYGVPIYESLNGPQMSTDNIGNITYKLMFN